jgi:hypothetical protein
VPSDVFATRTHWIPFKIRNKLNEVLLNVVNGKNELYGLPEPNTPFGATHPTINDELLYKIRHGKVLPRVNIDRYEGKTVHFIDGKSEEVDVIIACTGYILAHPFFDPEFIDYRTGDVPLYLKMLHPQYENLYFVGMFQPLGCIWPLAELQSKIVAANIAGDWERPKHTAALAQREVDRPHYRQIKTPRHTITVDFHLFRKELKKVLSGIKVSELKGI